MRVNLLTIGSICWSIQRRQQSVGMPERVQQVGR